MAYHLLISPSPGDGKCLRWLWQCQSLPHTKVQRGLLCATGRGSIPTHRAGLELQLRLLCPRVWKAQPGAHQPPAQRLQALFRSQTSPSSSTASQGQRENRALIAPCPARCHILHELWDVWDAHAQRRCSPGLTPDTPKPSLHQSPRAGAAQSAPRLCPWARGGAPGAGGTKGVPGPALPV